MKVEFKKNLKIHYNLTDVVMPQDAVTEADRRCPKGVSSPWSLLIHPLLCVYDHRVTAYSPRPLQGDNVTHTHA